MEVFNTKMVAKKSFPYNNRTVKAGDSFDATEAHAHLLHLNGNASYEQGEPIEAARYKPRRKPKRKYQRRDMVAGD